MQYCSKNSIRNQSSYHYHACKNVNNSPVVFRRCGKHQRGEKFSCGKGAAVWSIVGAGVHNLQSWDCLVYDHCSLHVRINLQVIMAIRHVDKNSLYLWIFTFVVIQRHLLKFPVWIILVSSLLSSVENRFWFWQVWLERYFLLMCCYDTLLKSLEGYLFYVKLYEWLFLWKVIY